MTMPAAAPRSATDFLRHLPAPDQLPAAAPPHLSNAHIHLPPNFSAFASVGEAVRLAHEEGVAVLGASNYYDYGVYDIFAREAASRGVFPLFGLEIITLDDDLRTRGVKVNDPGNPGKFYLCGKGVAAFDPMTDTARYLLGVIRENDAARIATMTQSLADLFASRGGVATGLTADNIRAHVAGRYDCPVETVFLQERHLAEAFQQALFKQVEPKERAPVLARVFGAPSKDASDAGAVQGEIRSLLMKAGKPAFVPETFVDFDHACKLILALGGFPCYPTLADGTDPVCPFEETPEVLIENLRARNLHAAELIPIRNTPAVLTRYVRALRDADFVVTAGTEHNTPDLVPLAPTCLGGEPIPADVAAIFAEGACVVAAHQYQTARGLPGFVTAHGNPAPGYPSDDARIRDFARLGASVIAAYRAG